MKVQIKRQKRRNEKFKQDSFDLKPWLNAEFSTYMLSTSYKTKRQDKRQYLRRNEFSALLFELVNSPFCWTIWKYLTDNWQICNFKFFIFIEKLRLDFKL